MKYCELGELGEFIMRGKFSKNDFVNDGIQCISSLPILGDDSIVLDSIDERVNIMQAQQLVNVQYGDVVILTKSYTREKLGRGSAWLGKQAVTGNEIAVFRHNESPRYLAYCTRREGYVKSVLSSATFGIVNNISLDRMKRIKDPNNIYNSKIDFINENEELNPIIEIKDKEMVIEPEIKTNVSNYRLPIYRENAPIILNRNFEKKVKAGGYDQEKVFESYAIYAKGGLV